MDSVSGKRTRCIREKDKNFPNWCTCVDRTGTLLHAVNRIYLCFALHVFSMRIVARLFSLALLPLVMLMLGWQLGVRFEQQSLEHAYNRLDWLYAGQTGSGELIQDPEKEVDITLLW